MDRQRVVIVGGGFGGLAATRALRGAAADWTTTRIGDRQAPLIEGDLATVERAAPDAVVP